MEQQESYELGLVMAGAVSAGAYSSGVVDFLLQALREWSRYNDSKAPGERLPYNVRLKVISGTSAGGMTAAMLTSALTDPEYAPAYGFPAKTPEKNVFFDSWVKEIDIGPLLETEDLKSGDPVVSVLDCTVLDKIGKQAVGDYKREYTLHPYLAPDYQVMLTTSNLRGIPYDIKFDGTYQQYAMTLHQDNMHFVLAPQDPKKKGAFWLDPSLQGLDGSWERFKETALATGAFPLALAPRVLERPIRDYDAWKWWVSVQTEGSDCARQRGDEKGIRSSVLKSIPPNWTDPMLTDWENNGKYQYVSVDGGVFNNQPLELARRALAGDDMYNPRDAACACRSLIMVDPFPNDVNYPVKPSQYLDRSLGSVLGRLVTSMKTQARFKTEELGYAQDPTVFSRFLIAPKRKGAPKGEALATSMLDAFGGFLHEPFRRHDFALGRRNAQRFFETRLVLPVREYIGADGKSRPGAETNPLFKPMVDLYRQGLLTDEEKEAFFHTASDGTLYVRIVPRFGTAVQPCRQVSWESIKVTKEKLEKIAGKVESRMIAVGEALLFKNGSGFWGKVETAAKKALFRTLVRFVKLKSRAYDAMADAAKGYGLLEE